MMCINTHSATWTKHTELRVRRSWPLVVERQELSFWVEASITESQTCESYGRCSSSKSKFPLLVCWAHSRLVCRKENQSAEQTVWGGSKRWVMWDLGAVMRALESAHSEVQSALEGTHSHGLNYIFLKYVFSAYRMSLKREESSRRCPGWIWRGDDSRLA